MPDEFQLAGITQTIFRGILMVSWRFPLVRRCVSCSLGGPAPICTIQNGWRKLAESGCFSCLIKPAHVSMELFFVGDWLNHRIFWYLLRASSASNVWSFLVCFVGRNLLYPTWCLIGCWKVAALPTHLPVEQKQLNNNWNKRNAQFAMCRWFCPLNCGVCARFCAAGCV